MMIGQSVTLETVEPARKPPGKKIPLVYNTDYNVFSLSGTTTKVSVKKGGL
jgi:hypothetical protein